MWGVMWGGVGWKCCINIYPSPILFIFFGDWVSIVERYITRRYSAMGDGHGNQNQDADKIWAGLGLMLHLESVATHMRTAVEQMQKCQGNEEGE